MPPKPINQLSGMPQIAAAFAGWMQPITIVKITQVIIDGFVTSVSNQITFKGTIQPLNPQQIQLKPEGQRAWTWLQIHCFASNLNLEPNDRILYNGQKYKVMANNDYSLNNYIEYHIIRDYESIT